MIHLKFLIPLLFTSFTVFASDSNFSEKKDGVNLSDSSFPWELFLDRGKILGCIYDNRFYSLGSILVLESLPRKCGLGPDRNGVWDILSEAELVLFKENIEIQQQLERESTYIGKEPISRQEARVIRYLRGVKKVSEKRKN